MKPDLFDRMPITHSVKKNPKLVKAATIWFLLIEDMSRPNARKQELISIRPRYPLHSTPKSNGPKREVKNGNRSVNPSIIRTRVQLARNFPKTTCTSVIGEVSSNSIVPDFLSSAKSFIVSTGVKKRRIIARFPNTTCITSAPGMVPE